MKTYIFLKKIVSILVMIDLIILPCLLHANPLNILDKEQVRPIYFRRHVNSDITSSSNKNYGHPVIKDENNRYSISFNEKFLLNDHNFYLIDKETPIGYIAIKNKNVALLGFENHNFLLDGAVNLISLIIGCGGNLTLSQQFDVTNVTKLRAKNINIKDKLISANSLFLQAEDQIELTADIRSEVIDIEADNVMNEGDLYSNQDVNAWVRYKFDNKGSLRVKRNYTVKQKPVDDSTKTKLRLQYTNHQGAGVFVGSVQHINATSFKDYGKNYTKYLSIIDACQLNFGGGCKYKCQWGLLNASNGETSIANGARLRSMQFLALISKDNINIARDARGRNKIMIDNGLYFSFSKYLNDKYSNDIYQNINFVKPEKNKWQHILKQKGLFVFTQNNFNTQIDADIFTPQSSITIDCKNKAELRGKLKSGYFSENSLNITAGRADLLGEITSHGLLSLQTKDNLKLEGPISATNATIASKGSLVNLSCINAQNSIKLFIEGAVKNHGTFLTDLFELHGLSLDNHGHITGTKNLKIILKKDLENYGGIAGGDSFYQAEAFKNHNILSSTENMQIDAVQLEQGREGILSVDKALKCDLEKDLWNRGRIQAKNALFNQRNFLNFFGGTFDIENALTIHSDFFSLNFLASMAANQLSINSGIANINAFGFLNGRENLSMTASLANLNLGGIARTSGHYSSTALFDINLGLTQAFKKTSFALFSSDLGLSLPSPPTMASLLNYKNWYDHPLVSVTQMAVNNFAPSGIAPLFNLGMTALRLPTMFERVKNFSGDLLSEKPKSIGQYISILGDLVKIGSSIFEMGKSTVNTIENLEHMVEDPTSWSKCSTPDFSQFAHNVGSHFLSPSIVQNSFISLGEGLTISGNITHNQLFEINGGVTVSDSYSDKTLSGLTHGVTIANQYHLEAFKDYDWDGKGIFNTAYIKAEEHLLIQNASLNSQHLTVLSENVLNIKNSHISGSSEALIKAKERLDIQETSLNFQQLAITSEDVLDLKNSHISGSSETFIKGKNVKKLEGNEFKGGHITFDLGNTEEGVESVIAVVDGCANVKADLLMANVDWVNDQDRHFKHYDLGLAFHSIENRKNIEADGELRLYGEASFKNEMNGSIRAQNGLITGTQGQHLNLGLLSGGKGDNYVFGNTIESYVTTEQQTHTLPKRKHGLFSGFIPHHHRTTHKEIRHTPQYTGRNVIQIANAGISHRGTEITALENAYLKSKSGDITLNPHEYNRRTQYDSIHVWDSVKIAAGSNIFIQTLGHLNAPVLHATAGGNIVLDASAGMNLDGRAMTYVADKGSRTSGWGPWKKKHKWEREEAVFYQTQLHAGGELHLKTDQGAVSASAAKFFANGEITVDALHDLNLGAVVAKTHSYDKKDSWRKNKTTHNSETQSDVMVASSNKSIEMRARDGLITSLGGILMAPHVGLFGNKGIDWNVVPLEKWSQTNENWFSLDIGAGSLGTTYHQSEIDQCITFAQQGIILADQLDIVTGEGTTANFQGTNLKGFSGDKIKELLIDADTLLLGGTPIKVITDTSSWSVGAGFNFVTRAPTFSASYGAGHHSQLTYQQASVEVDHMTIKHEGTKIKITDGIKGNINSTSGALFDLEVDHKQTVEKERDFSAGVSFAGNNQIGVNAGYNQTEKKTSDVTEFTIGDAPNLGHRVDIHHKDSETHVGAQINLSTSSDLSNITGGITLQKGNQTIGFDLENMDKISKGFDNISKFDLNSICSNVGKELDFSNINSLSDFTQAVSNAASKGHDLLEEISKVNNLLQGVGIDLKGFDKTLSQVEGTLDKIGQINKGVKFLENLPDQLTHTLDYVTKYLHNFSKPESFSDVTKHLGEAIAQGQALSNKVETISQTLKGFGINVDQLDQSINKAKDILTKASNLQAKLDNGAKLVDKVYKNSPHNLSELESSIKKALPNLENFNLTNVHNLSDFVHVVGTTIDHAKGMLTQATELNKQLEEIGIHSPDVVQSLSKVTKELDKVATIQSNVEHGIKVVETIEKNLPQTLEKIGDELNKGFSNLMHLKFEGIHSFDDISQLFGNAITKSHTLLDNLRNLNNALTENGINVNEFATSLNQFEKVLKNAEDIQVKIETGVQLVEQVSESLSKSLETLNKDLKKELPSFDEFNFTGIDSVTQSINKIGIALTKGQKWITKTKELSQKFHDLGIASPTIDHSLIQAEKFLDNATEVQENSEKRIEAFKQFSDELTMVIGEFGRSISNQLDIKAFKFDDIHSMTDFTHTFGQVLHKEQDWVTIVSHLNDFLHDMGIQSSESNKSVEQVKHILDQASQVKSDVEAQLKVFEKL